MSVEGIRRDANASAVKHTGSQPGVGAGADSSGIRGKHPPLTPDRELTDRAVTLLADPEARTSGGAGRAVEAVRDPQKKNALGALYSILTSGESETFAKGLSAEKISDAMAAANEAVGKILEENGECSSDAADAIYQRKFFEVLEMPLSLWPKELFEKFIKTDLNAFSEKMVSVSKAPLLQSGDYSEYGVNYAMEAFFSKGGIPHLLGDGEHPDYLEECFKNPAEACALMEKLSQKCAAGGNLEFVNNAVRAASDDYIRTVNANVANGVLNPHMEPLMREFGKIFFKTLMADLGTEPVAAPKPKPKPSEMKPPAAAPALAPTTPVPTLTAVTAPKAEPPVAAPAPAAASTPTTPLTAVTAPKAEPSEMKPPVAAPALAPAALKAEDSKAEPLAASTTPAPMLAAVTGPKAEPPVAAPAPAALKAEPSEMKPPVAPKTEASGVDQLAQIAQMEKLLKEATEPNLGEVKQKLENVLGKLRSGEDVSREEIAKLIEELEQKRTDAEQARNLDWWDKILMWLGFLGSNTPPPPPPPPTDADEAKKKDKKK